MIMPAGSRKRDIGLSNGKRKTVQGGRNGFCVAEFIGPESLGVQTPVIAGITATLNPVLYKKTFSTTVGDLVYDDCRVHVARLRFDLRSVDAVTGGPGESLIGGGMIFNSKDKTTYITHRTVTVPLEFPIECPDEGVFVVIEWIVTDEVKEHDNVTPGIWCTEPSDIGTSWNRWPIGTPWKQINAGKGGNDARAFCIGVEIYK